MEPDQCLQIIEMIRQASRPIVIAGSGSWYSGVDKELAVFAEKTGMPAFTSSLGRGTIPDTHPLCFESSMGIRPGAALFANTNADLILFLGARMNLYFIFGGIFQKQAKIVQVDIEPEEIGRNRSIDLSVVSDIKALLSVCNRIIEEKNISQELKKRFEGWILEVRKAQEEGKARANPQWESIATPIHPLRLAAEINNFMSREDDIVVADGGDTQIWMGMTRTIRRPGHYLDSGLYGCLGVGLPYANAAKYLYPEKRVCLVIGDGSVGFNFMEFETAIRKNLPIVAVISNDLGWGMIRHSQELKIGRAIPNGTYIGKVHYHEMVEALGGKGILVEKPEDICPAIEEAFASEKTSCINVMTDPTTISPGSVALANLGAYK